jgi:hypothetical protein
VGPRLKVTAWVPVEKKEKIKGNMVMIIRKVIDRQMEFY